MRPARWSRNRLHPSRKRISQPIRMPRFRHCIFPAGRRRRIFTISSLIPTGSSDLLKANLQYDNSTFISDLEKMGFYVAKCSQSNYPRTDVSLGSSLNLDYLQNLNDKFAPKNEDRTQLWESILHSTVRYELENAGYKTVAFATGFAFTEVTSADLYLSPSPVWSPLTEFEILLIRTTPLRHPARCRPGQSRSDRRGALSRAHQIGLE